MEAIIRLREEEEESSGTETVAEKCIKSEPNTSESMLQPSCHI